MGSDTYFLPNPLRHSETSSAHHRNTNSHAKSTISRDSQSYSPRMLYVTQRCRKWSLFQSWATLSYLSPGVTGIWCSCPQFLLLTPHSARPQANANNQMNQISFCLLYCSSCFFQLPSPNQNASPNYKTKVPGPSNRYSLWGILFLTPALWVLCVSHVALLNFH